MRCVIGSTHRSDQASAGWVCSYSVAPAPPGRGRQDGTCHGLPAAIATAKPTPRSTATRAWRARSAVIAHNAANAPPRASPTLRAPPALRASPTRRAPPTRRALPPPRASPRAPRTPRALMSARRSARTGQTSIVRREATASAGAARGLTRASRDHRPAAQRDAPRAPLDVLVAVAIAILERSPGRSLGSLVRVRTLLGRLHGLRLLEIVFVVTHRKSSWCRTSAETKPGNAPSLALPGDPARANARCQNVVRAPTTRHARPRRCAGRSSPSVVRRCAVTHGPRSRTAHAAEPRRFVSRAKPAPARRRFAGRTRLRLDASCRRRSRASRTSTAPRRCPRAVTPFRTTCSTASRSPTSPGPGGRPGPAAGSGRRARR